MANPREQKSITDTATKKPDPRCSFCNNGPEHAGLLIESPTFSRASAAYICAQCVELCSSILAHHKRPPTASHEPDTEYFLDCTDGMPEK
jgi:hypothetical protein